MMKVKLKDLIRFGEVSGVFDGQDIPVKIAFSLAKIADAAQKEGDFYRQEIQKIAAECLQTDENGQFIQATDGTGYLIKEEKMGDFYTKMAELDELEVEINCNPINLDTLDQLTISVESMEKLMPFIEE